MKPKPDRQKEVAKLLRSARPGETLVDVLGRQWERERWSKAKEAWEILWHHGRTTNGQLALDGKKPGQLCIGEEDEE